MVKMIVFRRLLIIIFCNGGEVCIESICDSYRIIIRIVVSIHGNYFICILVIISYDFDNIPCHFSSIVRF